MARYRIIARSPGVFDIQRKRRFWFGWSVLATEYSMNGADQSLNEIREHGKVNPGYPRVVRQVED